MRSPTLCDKPGCSRMFFLRHAGEIIQGNLLLVDPKRKRVDIALALRSRGICFFEIRAARIFFYDRVLCQAVCAQEHVASNFFWPCPVVGRAPFI